MKSEVYEELKSIAKRYRKYGITISDVMQFYKGWHEAKISDKAALVGIRMGLAEIYNEREYFSSDDIAAVTGESVNEVNKRIEEHEDELLAKEDIVKITFPYF